jgi:hypothetical protein
MGHWTCYCMHGGNRKCMQKVVGWWCLQCREPIKWVFSVFGRKISPGRKEVQKLKRATKSM